MRSKKGFTLIELIVAIGIFSLIMISIVSVFVSIAKAYDKAKIMKNLKENMDFALSSIAKDVRMGRIEGTFTVGGGGTPITNNGTTRQEYFAVTRNREQQVACYYINSEYLGVAIGSSGSADPVVFADCPASGYEKIVDLRGTEMNFDVGTSGTAGFYSLATSPPDDPTSRGWVELNFNTIMASGQEMNADSINIQTIVSSRDYGWEKVAP